MAIIDTAPDPRHFQCRYLFTTGHRCGSPRLRHEALCFHHLGTSAPRPEDTPKPGPSRSPATSLLSQPTPRCTRSTR